MLLSAKCTSCLQCIAVLGDTLRKPKPRAAPDMEQVNRVLRIRTSLDHVSGPEGVYLLCRRQLPAANDFGLRL